MPGNPFDDLTAESTALDEVVADLPDEQWRLPTPAPGWTIAHQIAHLAWTDRITLLSLAGRFAEARPDQDVRLEDLVESGAADRAVLPPAVLVADWRSGRDQVAEGLPAVPPGQKLDWYGPPMSALSMATARLMETWAHGQDIRDALGLPPSDTSRLRNIAHLAVRTRDYAFEMNGRTPPEAEIAVELTGPDGEVWQWGDAQAGQRVTGPALDFCLRATRRRHRSDVAVVAHGDDADAWLDVVQAYAGGPGRGRHPGQFDR